MATKRFIGLAMLSLRVFADTSAENAMILNEEMEYLLKVADQAQVYAEPGAGPSRALNDRSNGIAPTQMRDIERAEDRYFSDEVSFQAAASEQTSPTEDTDFVDEDSGDDDFRMDGRPPKRRARSR